MYWNGEFQFSAFSLVDNISVQRSEVERLFDEKCCRTGSEINAKSLECTHAPLCV